MVFKLGELFCGPGGLGLAATSSTSKDKKYSITHEWANDYDKDTCNTYTKNICPNRPESVICEDVKKLDISSLSAIDAFAFGFPCNDFSHVGEQKGLDGTFGALYTYGVKVLKRFQPKWFIAENVGGIRNSNEGKAFTKILKELFNTGYDLYPHFYKFENYGVPQNRHRVIIVGIRKDLDIVYKIPSSEPYKNIDVSAGNAILNPPITSNMFNVEYTRQSPTVIERLKYIKPGENAFNANLPEHLKLNVKGAKISQIYRRLQFDKPAYTITGSGGGGTHVYHWSENRALTNRERARLQTFPDNFVFYGSKESVRKQIGMAVPVRGAKVIFESILNTFAGIDYKWEEPSFPCILHRKQETLTDSCFLDSFLVLGKEDSE